MRGDLQSVAAELVSRRDAVMVRFELRPHAGMVGVWPG